MCTEEQQGYTIGQDATFYLSRSRWHAFFYGFNALAFSFSIWASPLRVEFALTAWFIAALLFAWCLGESRFGLLALRHSADGEWSLKYGVPGKCGASRAVEGLDSWQPIGAIFIKRVTPLTLQLVVVPDGFPGAGGWFANAATYITGAPRINVTLWRDQLPSSELRLLRVLLSLG